MAYFPFFVDIKDKKCLIVGGGKVALRKAKYLLQYNTIITVVSPNFILEFESIKDNICIKKRQFIKEDLTNIFFVIAATDDSYINNKISELCHENNIFINVVDKKELCSFIFPSLIQKGDISIGITTAGKSPLISKYIKNKILEQIPDYFEHFVELLGYYREEIKKKVSSQSLRIAILKEITDIGIRNKGVITNDDLEYIILKIFEEHEKK